MAGQATIVLLVWFGDKLFAALGRPMPEAVKAMQESPWMYSLGAFFLGSQLQAGLLQTGAFEIYVNDELVFSKLQTGNMIRDQDVKRIFEPFGIDIPTHHRPLR